MLNILYIGQDLFTAEREYIFNEDDFVRLVRERLGNEAERYLKTIIEERDTNEMRLDSAEQIDNLRQELDEARNKLDDLRGADDKLDAIRAILDDW